MSDETLLLFKLHPCSRGLTDQEAQEIADASELVRCERGDVICRADEPVQFIFLIVHGRVCLELLDVHGKLVMRRFQMAGGQFGAMAASLAEPTPINGTAEDPSVLLRIGYGKALELSNKYDAFRANYLRMISDSVKQALFNDKTAVPPAVTVFNHQSDETRVVSRKLTERLVGLGETPGIFCDRAMDVTGIQVIRIFGEEGEANPEQIKHLAAECLQSGRVIFDVDATLDLQRVSQGFEAAEQVFWCVTPGNWEASLSRLQAIEARAPSWREKISIVWLLQPAEKVPDSTSPHSLARMRWQRWESKQPWKRFQKFANCFTVWTRICFLCQRINLHTAPFSSWPMNGNVQAWQVTQSVERKLAALQQVDRMSEMPPILAMQSVVDSTVVVPKLITVLFQRLKSIAPRKPVELRFAHVADRSFANCFR